MLLLPLPRLTPTRICLFIFIVVVLLVTTTKVKGTETCLNTDGSVANAPPDCTCGSEKCTSSSGLFCSTASGAGACSNQRSPYQLADNGLCTDISGGKYITDKGTCESAAAALGLDDTAASLSSSSDSAYPKGCYQNPQLWLYFNTAAASNSLCSDTYVCLCEIITCAITNGTAVNSQPCDCSGTPCTSATGLVCKITAAGAGNM